MERRRTELDAKLDQLTHEKLKKLAAQKDRVEMLQAQVSSCLEHSEGGLRTGTEAEVLAMKKPVLQRVKQILDEVQTCLEPEEEANIAVILTMKEDLHKSCVQFVDIAENPGNGQRNVLQCTQVGEQSSFTVQIDNKEAIHLTAELTHKSSTNCTIVRQSEGQCEVSYRPIRVGKHKLHIKASGCDVLGSPFTIVVSPSTKHLRKPSVVLNDIEGPLALTVNHDHDIVVTESNSNLTTVAILSQDGKRRQRIALPGEGKFINPHGITMDSTGNMYITDRDANCVHVFTPKHSLTKSVGSRGNDNLQFCHPIGIMFNPKENRLYICDEDNHQVQVLEKDLSYHSCFGKKGKETGEFINPLYSALNSKGNVYITDCYNNRVQVFTPDGQFIRSIQDKSCGQKLQHPYAIAIDSVDNVYVSERDRHCITMFDSEGQYVASFGSKGDEECQFNGVYGLYYDDFCSSLFVSDHFNNRVLKFDMSL